MLWIRISILTLLIEGITIFMRFGLGLQSTRDTAFLAKYTMGLRIHHGYIGILIVVLTLVFSRLPSGIRNWLLAIGGALFLSDIIHHFIVLWIFVGNPEFHIWYRDFKK